MVLSYGAVGRGGGSVVAGWFSGFELLTFRTFFPKNENKTLLSACPCYSHLNLPSAPDIKRNVGICICLVFLLLDGHLWEQRPSFFGSRSK